MSRFGRLETMWDRRPSTWHEHVTDSDAFASMRSELMRVAELKPTDVVVDLGAGTGYVCHAIAPLVDRVIAVDLSANMLSALEERSVQQGCTNIEVRAADLAQVDFPAREVDVVISTYALHHLRDEDKRALISRCARWLAPGGKIVIVDMMFGRGATSADRKIIRAKVLALARKGPGGLWRIAKNLVRFGFRVGTELPVPSHFWVDAMEAAGFTDVRFEPLRSEAGLVVGFAPAVESPVTATPSRSAFPARSPEHGSTDADDGKRVEPHAS
jgi:ubiquinone/menaquinone biosynthesis C-methylase UbiE